MTDRIVSPPRPADQPDAVLVRYEVTSGQQYGVWVTPAEAQVQIEKWRAAWQSGHPHIGGTVELNTDILIRSNAVVAVLIGDRW